MYWTTKTINGLFCPAIVINYAGCDHMYVKASIGFDTERKAEEAARSLFEDIRSEILLRLKQASYRE